MEREIKMFCCDGPNVKSIDVLENRRICDKFWRKHLGKTYCAVKKSHCRMQRYGIQKTLDCYFILSLHNPNASGVMDLWESYYHILMCSDKDILMCSDKVNKKVVTPLNSGKPSRNCVDSIHYP